MLMIVMISITFINITTTILITIREVVTAMGKLLYRPKMLSGFGLMKVSGLLS